ncbi:MAG: S-adenosyl-l-methionine hydroxide adenosyltransferase family protein [Bacteroidia bacterium]
MAVITLTTDFGLKDHHLAMVKGAIINMAPHATIIDISHQIEAHDTQSASFILKNAFHAFPKGSIHIIGINTEPSDENLFTCVKYQGHYFISTDNGIFSLIMDENQPEVIVEIIPENIHQLSFICKDVFVPAAIKLLNGKGIESLGPKRNQVQKLINMKAYADQIGIRGNIIYIDNYENAISNISKELFEQHFSNTHFEIQLKPSKRFSELYKDSEYTLNKISFFYNEVDKGEILARFNSSGLLEIAINKGNASSLLNLKTGDVIRILKYDNQNS